MARTSDPEKVREWQRRLARFEKSELAITRFCQEEGVSPASFYQWRKRMTRTASVREVKDAVPDDFVPVRLVHSSVVTIHLPGGTQVELPGSDPQVLQLAIQTIAQIDAERVAGGSHADAGQ